MGKGAGYERWAKGFNLKQTAKTLLFLQQHDIHSYEDLERMTNEAVTGADQLPEGTKLPTVKELNAERTRLILERQAEYAEYRKAKADRTEFIRAKQNADVILRRQQEERDEKMQEKL